MPQSNGRAESEIITMKSLIHGSWTSGAFNAANFDKSILLFHHAPRSGGASTAQLIFNRPVHDCLPAHRRSFAPEWQKAANVFKKRTRRSKELQIAHYNKKTRPLIPFVVGNHVLIQNPDSKLWDTSGVIVEVCKHRDYLIQTPSGVYFDAIGDFSAFVSQYSQHPPVFRLVLCYPTQGQPSRTRRSRFRHRNRRRRFADPRVPANLSEFISLIIGHSDLICFFFMPSHFVSTAFPYCVMIAPTTLFIYPTVLFCMYCVSKKHFT